MRKQVLLGMIMFAMGASFIGCGKVIIKQKLTHQL